MLVCKQLKKERIDLKNTLSTIELLVNTLKEMRQDAEKEFHILCDKLKNLANVIATEITKKRTAKKQTNRANPQVFSVEDYYRVTVFIPFTDNFINQLTTRFLNHKSVLEGNMYIDLSSSIFTDAEKISFENLVEFYLSPVESDNAYVEIKI
ncbi:Hypothetical protein CINCED_3A001083 [Cinara cedri]|uniref:Uncharacterized protein n=1 Tax=Cinara cedri TaxID=506608 RepID=A0A5E4M6T8_9HEMI|nr:Hypothetical protein CINCED_3A001083 [Cinara cedri]